jgi:hypothetical protein
MSQTKIRDRLDPAVVGTPLETILRKEAEPWH